MKKLFVANWKMSLNVEESRLLCRQILRFVARKSSLPEMVICPSFPMLEQAKRIFKGSPIHVGAQNMFWELQGAYTGEVSASVLRELGCEYVILGHSERRSYGGETNETVGKKVEAAFAQKLIPIICVGETYEEKKQGISKKVLRAQLRASFKNSSSSHPAIIAYEPRWAISTQKHAEPTPSDAVEMILFLKELLEKDQGKQREKNTRFIYGGSVNTHNAQVFLRELVIDGVLVGGASTRAEEFQQMLEQIRSIHKEQS